MKPLKRIPVVAITVKPDAWEPHQAGSFKWTPSERFTDQNIIGMRIFAPVVAAPRMAGLPVKCAVLAPPIKPRTRLKSRLCRRCVEVNAIAYATRYRPERFRRGASRAVLPLQAGTEAFVHWR